MTLDIRKPELPAKKTQADLSTRNYNQNCSMVRTIVSSEEIVTTKKITKRIETYESPLIEAEVVNG